MLTEEYIYSRDKIVQNTCLSFKPSKGPLSHVTYLAGNMVKYFPCPRTYTSKEGVRRILSKKCMGWK
jgi:hypothetical protein